MIFFLRRLGRSSPAPYAYFVQDVFEFPLDSAVISDRKIVRSRNSGINRVGCKEGVASSMFFHLFDSGSQCFFERKMGRIIYPLCFSEEKVGIKIFVSDD